MNYNKYNLTFPENNIYLIEKFSDNSPINTIAGILKLKNKFDKNLCNKIINKIIENNDALRIRIIEENNSPYQYVKEFEYEDFECIDMSNKTEIEIEKYFYSCVDVPIKFIDNKLYEFKIIEQGNNEGYIFMKLHHIVSDAWTLGQIINQIVKIYNDILESEAGTNSVPSYLDFIETEKEYIVSEKFNKDEQFWKEYLDNIKSPISLKESISKISTKAKRYTVKLNKNINDKINEYLKSNKLSPYALFLAALFTYIYRIKDENDIVLGTPILNRSNFKEKQMLGMFVSVIPIRIKMEETNTFIDLVKKVGTDTMNLFRHQKYPISKILENIHGTTEIKDKIYNIILSYQNARADIENSETFSTKWIFNGNIQEELQIHIMDMDNEGVLSINYDYLSDLFDAKEIKYLHTRLMAIIEDAIENLDVKVSDVNIMSENEKSRILDKFNDTMVKTNYTKKTTIVSLFEKQVEKNPDSIALVFEEKQMTYRELNDKSNQLADFLKNNKDVKVGDVVAIMQKRGFEMIISILGILKTGAAYLPIDPEFPQDRINYMIENSNSKVVITNIEDIRVSGDVININEFDYNRYSDSNAVAATTSQDLIYIMYTSGSTGTPKATMIKHENVINYIESVKRYMDYKNSTNVLSVTTTSFDIFVFELFPTICLGLSLFIANEKQQKFPEELIEFIHKNKVEKICTTPSRIQSILDICRDDKKLDSIKEYNLGGEPITNKILEKIKARFNATIYNCYGPTETTVYSTFKNLTFTNTINIGKPINNTKVFILDRRNNLLPIGVEGEIAIGGLGVGNGYYKQEELTSQKYIYNKLISEDKIYLTGDIGRWNNDAELECLGRNDNQVKINGKRVELGEISKVISKFDSVEEVVTKVIDNGRTNYLCAYMVGQDININDLKEYLSSKLPRYMIPSSYMIIDKMPLSHNGKIDMKKLPLPTKNVSEKVYIEPRNKIELDIHGVIRQYANVDKISIEDNFFDIGIDSLTIIKIQVALFSMGYLFSTQDFYNYPTIASISKVENVDKNRGKTKALDKIRKETFKNNDFKVINVWKKRKISNVLLTGSTGFLGIHVLKELLRNTRANIYCIVRSKESDSETRLLNKLKYYFGINYINKRIHVLNGDLSKDNFGLTIEEYDMLNDNIDEIIHIAANVKYYGNYMDFEQNNVISTENIVKLAYKNNKKINYISSLGVSGHYLVEHESENSVFSEDYLYIGQNYEQNNYVKSKYLIEHNLYEYHDKDNLDIRVFRVGNLTGRYSDGYFQENQNENAFYNILKSILKLKAIPVNMLNNSIDFSPVDIVAKAIVKIIRIEGSINHTFHIANSNTTTTKEIVELMNKIGKNITIMNDDAFSKYAQEISNQKDKADALDGLINDINSEKKLMFNAGVITNSKKSNELLNKLGIKFKKLDKRYFKKVIKLIRK